MLVCAVFESQIYFLSPTATAVAQGSCSQQNGVGCCVLSTAVIHLGFTYRKWVGSAIKQEC